MNLAISMGWLFMFTGIIGLLIEASDRKEGWVLGVVTCAGIAALGASLFVWGLA